jgi:hypothetical protein
MEDGTAFSDRVTASKDNYADTSEKVIMFIGGRGVTS